jgi:NADH-quinone oxidoreductase subunit G
MSNDLRTVIIDGQEVRMPAEYTLLQACEEAGAEIPRFCYHERLSIAGNCRMCLVQWEGAPKPIASCAQSVGDLRPNRDGTPPRINTANDYVKKAREGVMEFLLINHPLDCPICDQGGECDLQDQALFYGRSHTRYEENKRAVEDKDFGPLVKTIMTRCIQCTRCVRFISEVAGVEEIGMTQRGENAEITTYLEASLTSELSGNVIDLCPVGALTSKPYAFNARPWELEKTETIDVMDALGSAIRIDARGPAVLRILPRVNDAINEEWISDKTRFVWDGLQKKRLDRPFIRENGKLRAASWSEALEAVAARLKGDPSRIAAISGDLVDVESLKALLDLMRSLGVQNTDCRQDGSVLGFGARETYLFNPTIEAIDHADAILLIGTNPRVEAPVLNARIRKAWVHKGARIAQIGPRADLSYDVEHLGETGTDLKDIATRGHAFLEVLTKAHRPMVIVGNGATTRSDGEAILYYAGQLARQAGIVRGQGEEEAWNGFGILHTAAGRVGALDLGFLPGEGGLDAPAIVAGCRKGDIDTVFLMGADEIDPEAFGSAFVVYLGHHGDRGAQGGDVILPGAAYTEKPGTYVNTEGRVQQAQRAVFPKGEAREDWAIVRALSDRVGKPLPYDTYEALQDRLFADCPVFAGRNFAPGSAGAGTFDLSKLGREGRVLDLPLGSAVTDFYATNPIARASETLAKAAEAVSKARHVPMAAE